MRYEPTPSEQSSLDAMDATERMHYFITRTMESEEVWRLRHGDEWKVVVQDDGRSVMPLWPYRGLAEACAGAGETAAAISLEHFVFHELNELGANGIMLEIFPGKQPGLKLSAAELFRIFDRKLDEDQYFIEG